MKLSDELIENYQKLKPKIAERLEEFSNVPESEYFYELCFCLCTPQSSAKNADKVIQKLKSHNFQNKPFDPVSLLRSPEHYIRFHNTKAQRLLEVSQYFDELVDVLNSSILGPDKRNMLNVKINGMGLKECSHFLRNIGYRNLAILDRHILKHLVNCEVIPEIPNSLNPKTYFMIENQFIEFAETVGIPIDELDLLFWSFETGEILK